MQMGKNRTADILRLFSITLFAAAVGVAMVHGSEWTSSDGVIEVIEPDSAKFDRMDNPPVPFIALWVSKDETLRLGVMKTANPAHGKLIRSSTEEGLAEEVHGAITASSTLVVNGHEIWLMTAQGSSQGTKLQITQAIAQVNGSVYKVMAATVGDGPADQVAIDAFVNSIHITPSTSSLQPAPAANSDQGGADGIDPHDLSKKIGGAGALLLIIVIVWLVVRRGKSKR